MLSASVQTAIRLVYPPHCLACGGPVSTEFGLCGPCFSETHFISGLVCDTCGVPLPGEDPGAGVRCDDCLATSRPWSHGRAALFMPGRVASWSSRSSTATGTTSPARPRPGSPARPHPYCVRTA